MGGLSVPRAGERQWPFAVALIVTPGDHAPDDQTIDDLGGDDRPPGGPGGRLAVALAAYREGFCLLDVIETGARAGVTEGDVARLWSLAQYTDADAVFVAGAGPGVHGGLRAMADELRVLLRFLPAGSGDDAPPGTGQTASDQPPDQMEPGGASAAPGVHAAGPACGSGEPVSAAGPAGWPGRWRGPGRNARLQASRRPGPDLPGRADQRMGS